MAPTKYQKVKDTKKIVKMGAADALAIEMSAMKAQLHKMERQHMALVGRPAQQPNPDELIPRPRGTPGRSPPKGYNVRDAMGLRKSKRRYNMISVVSKELAAEHLNLRKTMTYQDKFAVCKVVAKAQREVPFLSRFQDGWPVRDIISRFLRNHINFLKRKGLYDLLGGETEMISDTEAEGDSDQEGESEAEDEGIDEDDDTTHAKLEMIAKLSGKKNDGRVSKGHKSSNHTQTSKKRKFVNNDDDDDGDDDEDEDIPKAKKAKPSIKKTKPISDDEDEDIPRVRKAKPSIKKTKPISDDEDEDIPKAKKAKPAKGQVVPAKKVAKEVVASKKRKTNNDDDDDENVRPAIKKKSSKTSKPPINSRPLTITIPKVKPSTGSKSSKTFKPAVEAEEEDEEAQLSPQAKPSSKMSKPINETRSIPKAKPSSKRTRPADEDEDEGEEDHVDDSEVEEGNQQAAMTEKQVCYDKASIFCLSSDYMTTNACFYKSGAIPLPSHCPRKGCSDTFPRYPSRDLLQKLIDYQEIVKEEGSNSTSQEYLRVEIALCFGITADSSLDEYVHEARMMGWKHEIDFTTLTPRILEMKDMLTSLFTSKAARSKNPVYKLIEKTLQEGRVGPGLEVFAAAKQIPQSVITRSRPGYYGTKGMFVIQSALIRLFDPITFDASSIKPLSLENFMTYILIPIVGCYLIKDDMGCSVAEAYDHMVDSAQVGLMLQDLEDDEDGAVDDIHRENMRLAKREREGYTEPTGPVLKDVNGRPLPRQRFNIPSPQNGIKQVKKKASSANKKQSALGYQPARSHSMATRNKKKAC